MKSQSIWHGGPAMCFTVEHMWLFSQQNNLTIHSQNNIESIQA